MSRHRLFVSLALLLPVTCAWGEPAVEKEPALTAEDKKYLDGLMREFLFDPKGAERVTVPTVVRTVWASADEVAADGWLVPGKDGRPGRVYFTDGASIPAPPDQKMKKVDFVAACQARYVLPPKKEEGDEKKGDLDRDEVFRKMRRTAVGAVQDDDLAVAAWLYRLGHEGLAGRALAAARKGEGDPRKRLREELAWSAFAGMVHAYMVRADEEALAHGERLLRLYADEVKGKEYRQAEQVVAELNRRQKKGTFGKVPPEKEPEGFDKWDAKKKTAYLIEALEEVDARQWGQPGGVDLVSDRRVMELIRLGDAVVPDLIDVLEKDERLTRSVQFGRDFFKSRNILSVGDAALMALSGILRVRHFDPAAESDSPEGGQNRMTKMASRVRAYWNDYGQLPFDERMMKVLTDPKASLYAKREAVQNLAMPDQNPFLSRIIHPNVSGKPLPRKRNPAVAKFSNPTVAEAILTTLDAELKAFDARIPKEYVKFNISTRRGIEEEYLLALVDLGDTRIGKEAAIRASIAKVPDMRRAWVEAAHYLGEPKPLQAFTADYLVGKIEASEEDNDGSELMNVVSTFIRVGTPETARALDTLVDPKHPHYKVLARQLLFRSPSPFRSDEGRWFDHPYCLRILRTALEDTTPSGAIITVEENSIERRGENGFRSQSIPKYLADPAVRREKVAERVCDVAAEKLGELVVGLPRYHPLFKDADKRLTAFKAAFDRYAGNYRRATWREQQSLGLSSWAPAYLPDIRPLARAATADDVKAGKAVFHLDGKGKPADLELPAVAVLKRDEKKEQPPRVLIVQAEVGPDCAVTYGIITREEVRVVPGRELTGIKTFAELEKEEKAAAEREKGKKD